jgi:excisionase family DNA binding protein
MLRIDSLSVGMRPRVRPPRNACASLCGPCPPRRRSSRCRSGRSPSRSRRSRWTDPCVQRCAETRNPEVDSTQQLWVSDRLLQVRPSRRKGAPSPTFAPSLFPHSDNASVPLVPVERTGPAEPLSALPTLLRIVEVATILRTSRKAIYTMVERAQLPGVIRIGRRLLVRRDDLFSWLDEGRVASPGGSRR